LENRGESIVPLADLAEDTLTLSILAFSWGGNGIGGRAGAFCCRRRCGRFFFFFATPDDDGGTNEFIMVRREWVWWWWWWYQFGKAKGMDGWNLILSQFSSLSAFLF
jgi:hypothetical protein